MNGDAYKEIENLSESLSNCRQALATARGRIERMATALSREGQTEMAERAANEIEDVFARGGMDRAQRFRNITKLIRRQISIAVSGDAYWED